MIVFRNYGRSVSTTGGHFRSGTTACGEARASMRALIK
jgi:hypothetical protein